MGTACYFGRTDLGCLVVLILFVQLCVSGLVLWTIMKVWESFTCETHMWSIATGCVERLSQTF